MDDKAKQLFDAIWEVGRSGALPPEMLEEHYVTGAKRLLEIGGPTAMAKAVNCLALVEPASHTFKEEWFPAALRWHLSGKTDRTKYSLAGSSLVRELHNQSVPAPSEAEFADMHQGITRLFDEALAAGTHDEVSRIWDRTNLFQIADPQELLALSKSPTPDDFKEAMLSLAAKTLGQW